MAYNNFDLNTDAVLVKVSIKQWSGRKKDETLAAQAAAQNNADSTSVEAYLTSVEKADRMPIQKIATAARDHLNFKSTVWDTTGWRLVATSGYEELRTEMEAFGIEFNAAVAAFTARHAELEAKAQAALGPILFARVGFPTEQELEDAFAFTVERQTITNPADIRLRHVSAAAVREIEDSTRRIQTEKVQDAMKQVTSRLAEVVERIATTLANEDGVFRDTMVTNVQELCRVIPSLNLTNDPYISKMADTISTSLGCLNPKTLREDKKVRKVAAEVAGKLATDLQKKLRTLTPTDT